MALGFVEIITIVFVAMSWAWHIVQVYTFIQDKFRPPEEKEQFDGQKALMLQELYNDMNDRREEYAHDQETADIVRAVQVQMQSLHAMHDKTDENGVKLWYIPRGMPRDVQSVLRILRGLRRTLERSRSWRDLRGHSSSDGHESV